MGTENDIPIAGAAPPPTYSAATGAPAPAQQPQIIYVQQGAPPPPQQVLVVDPYGNPAGVQTRHCNSCQSSQQVIYRPGYTPGTILCCIFFPICGWIMCCQSMAAEGHYCVRCGAKVF
ncbi:Oidioi.mRNA.OKI2018_I69.chr2.g6026.t1.cds [Oikopleura dioica]|uniref:Oidioi.mRNA.OKI2018_I69.chr2.g6026.t1.cds n=1 Tax=Oikopleura dioica TaxID=34765 RepID=A0ABN7T8Q5_OIKDI|nr:Oidioi.mRNA.OKI2018_I69.chr2.g6026.t1.cds [Oikopleura dioica]